jgi:hypothetical protein
MIRVVGRTLTQRGKRKNMIDGRSSSENLEKAKKVNAEK